MRKLAKNYYKSLLALFDCIRVTDKKGHVLDFYEGIEKTAGLIMSRTGSGRKIMFVGNGASAAISSHISTDFWKNGGVKAVAFNDPSLLTCVSNDFGNRHVFEKPIEMFGRIVGLDVIFGTKEPTRESVGVGDAASPLPRLAHALALGWLTAEFGGNYRWVS